MHNALVHKALKYSNLSESDISSLDRVCINQRDVPANYDILHEGDDVACVVIILRGWAFRYKTFSNGSRQVTGFLLPGDCCASHVSVPDVMEHNVAALTRCRVASVPQSRVEELLASRPALSRAFHWSQLVAEDTLRAWMASMGRRNSVQRVAHLMCELYTRGRDVGLVLKDSLDCELTHAVIGDSLGLTAVHVCRVLKKLRLTGCMELKNGSLKIYDLDALRKLADFDSAYLHQRVVSDGQRVSS